MTLASSTSSRSTGWWPAGLSLLFNLWRPCWQVLPTGLGPAGRDLALGRLAGFRRELRECLGKRADALFEACDAVLCRQERVHMRAELTLEPECRRPAVTANAGTARYGSAEASVWPRMHQRLGRQRKWKGHPGPLPVIEGTLIRLAVDRLPGDRSPEPLWLWTTSASAAASAGAGGRPGPGSPGFGALAGMGRCWRRWRNPPKARRTPAPPPATTSAKTRNQAKPPRRTHRPERLNNELRRGSRRLTLR